MKSTPETGTRDVQRYAVTFTDGKPPKLVLPGIPAHDDHPGQCQWTGSVFRLDRNHPVTGAVHQGVRGPDGHVEIRRLNAPPIRFEPASAIDSARRLKPALGWQLLPTDGEPYGFRDEHAARIAHVVRLLCGVSSALSEEHETAGVIAAFLASATAIEGLTTYGTGAQRYEAATTLQRDVDPQSGRPIGAARYLVDANTGELAIRVSDLQAVARMHIGASIPRGFLDARMQGIGWERRALDGHAAGGRAGRQGPHARTFIYRGHEPHIGSDDVE